MPPKNIPQATGVNVPPNDSDKTKFNGIISPGPSRRQPLDMSNHSGSTFGQTILCEREDACASSDKDNVLSEHQGPLDVPVPCKQSPDPSHDLHNPSNRRRSQGTVSYLSLGSIATRENDILTPLIRQMQEVTTADTEEEGFLHEGQTLKKRPSLTLEELTDVLCHINTAEACGLPIQWDIISGVVLPPDNYHTIVDAHDLRSLSLDEDHAPFDDIQVPGNFDEVTEGSSVSSISLEGHDFVVENWDSAEFSAVPFVQQRDISTRALSGK